MTLPSGSRPPGSVWLLAVALLLALGGGLLAHRVRTDAGRIEVRRIDLVGSDGALLSADLYLPGTATAEAPAPAVLTVHDRLSGKEAQAPFALEYARRGYVVLAIDQRGHGGSDPPARAAGSGGPAGLAWLRGLPLVDPTRIALSGHGTGGWAVLTAAAGAPDGYRSMILSAAATGPAPAAADVPAGTSTFPRNLGVVFGRFDEFARPLWGAATAAEIVTATKLRTVFGGPATVEPGVVYGDVDLGTARWLVQPPLTHDADRITPAGIGPTIDWLQRTVPAPTPLPAEDQVWPWHEVGTGLVLLGAGLALFALAGLLLRLPVFEALERVPARALGSAAATWWAGALSAIVVPAVGYPWLLERADAWLPVGPWSPQPLTNAVAAWLVGTGLVALGTWATWYALAGRRGGPAGVGLTGGALRSLGLAAAVVTGAYLLVAVVDGLFGTDARAWSLAARPVTALQARIALPYLLPFGFWFVVTGLVLHGQLRSDARVSLAATMVGNAVLAGAGLAGLLVVQYVPLFSGLPLPLGDPLATVLAFRLLVLLAVAAMLSSYLFHHTGRIWPGAFASTLLVTWLLVAGGATHVAF